MGNKIKKMSSLLKITALSMSVFAVSCHENIVSESHHSDSSSEVVDRKAYFIEKYPTYVEETNRNYYVGGKESNYYFFDIYCWIDSNGEWSCGIDPPLGVTSCSYKPAIDRYIREMQTTYPCKIGEMAELLSLFYDVTDPNLTVKETKLLGPDESFQRVYFPSENKYLYDTLGLKASYSYKVLRRSASAA